MPAISATASFSIATSRRRIGRDALAKRVERGDVGTVVATMVHGNGFGGSAAEILALRAKHGFRIHADAAYGGYFVLAENLGEGTDDLLRGGEADSIVIDPHKHGLQHTVRCVLFRDPEVGRLYKHDSPYSISVPRNCTWRDKSGVLPSGGGRGGFVGDAEIAAAEKERRIRRGLERGRKAALALFDKLARGCAFVTAFARIGHCCICGEAASVRKSSALSRKDSRSGGEARSASGRSGMPIRFWEEHLGAMSRIAKPSLAALRAQKPGISTG